MSIVVTGATGHLGRLVVQALLDRGTAPEEVLATGRNTARLEDLSALGVRTLTVDYNDAGALAAALTAADKVLLISSSEVGQRVAQHRTVIDAARTAGVALLAYTSIAKADTTPVLLAAEHKATEELIVASGVPYVFLRNSWYIENYTEQIALALESGAILGAAGDGRVSAATRADYAAAAAAVLTQDGHEGRVYELGGDEAFTLGEYATVLSTASGVPVQYRDLPEADYRQVLVDAGVPEAAAAVYADADAGLAHGELYVQGHALRELAGRPTAALADVVAAAVADRIPSAAR